MRTFSHATVPIVHLTLGDNTCAVSLFGGHVLSYCRAGVEKLFVSRRAKLDGSRPIRGGIPICWPWFGQLHPDINEHKLAHGLVRQQLWQLDAKVTRPDYVSITLSPCDISHSLWPHGLTCQLIITLTKSHLNVALHSNNQSHQTHPLSCALHSYCQVNDIQTTTINGITGEYIDNTHQNKIDLTPQPYEITTEIDRIHPNKDNPLQTNIFDNHELMSTLTHTGHDSIVVWNPWIEKSQSFVDMAEDEYKEMICIETALTQQFDLAPQSRHCLVQTIT